MSRRLRISSRAPDALRTRRNFLMADERYTLGIEEEFQIVDPQTRELGSRVAEMLEEGKMMLGEQVKPEMIQAQIEVGTGICRNIQEARRDITRLRSIVSGLARKQKLAIVAASRCARSSSESPWKVTPTPRPGLL